MKRFLYCIAVLGTMPVGAQPEIQPAHDEQLTIDIDDVQSEPALRPGFLSIIWENDSPFHTLFTNDEDRHYTNGASIELSFIPNDAAYNDWLRPLDLFGEFNEPRAAVGLSVRHFIFTPENILTTAAQPGDWPYSGWLTFGAFLQRQEGRTFDHMQLDLGVLGKNSGAEGLQKFVHSAMPGQDDPAWVNQLDSALGVQVKYQRRWRLRWIHDDTGSLKLASQDDKDGITGSRGSGFELIPYTGFRVGNVFDDASVGALVRYGWPLPDNFGPGRVYEFTDHTRRASREFGVSTYARAGARLVGHNYFLDGSSFGNDRVSLEPIVGEFQVGVEVEWKGCYLGYSQGVTTNEFEGQDGANRTGQFTFGYNLDF